MVLTRDQQQVKTLLTETIKLMCKNGLKFMSEFSIDALIGITVDHSNVFLINIHETVSCSALSHQEATHNTSTAVNDVIQPAVQTRSNKNSNKIISQDAQNEIDHKPRLNRLVETDAETDGVVCTADQQKLLCNIDDIESITSQEFAVRNVDETPNDKLVECSRKRKTSSRLVCRIPLFSAGVARGRSILGSDVNNETSQTREDGSLSREVDACSDVTMATSIKRQKRVNNKSLPGNINNNNNNNGNSSFEQFSAAVKDEVIDEITEMNDLRFNSPSLTLQQLTVTDEVSAFIDPCTKQLEQSAVSLRISARRAVHRRQLTSSSPAAAAAAATTSDLQSPTISPFYCMDCSKSFMSRQGLTVHARLHQGLYSYTCTVCGKGCSSTTQLRGHMVVAHTHVREFRCRYCYREYSYKNSFVAHVKEVHPGFDVEEAQWTETSSDVDIKESDLKL